MLSKRSHLGLLMLLVCAGMNSGIRGEAPPSIPSEILGMKAVEILRSNCMSCHGEKKRKGGLAMHTRKALLEGGETGPAIMDGKPDQSPMMGLLAADGDPHMPPKEQLPDDSIELLSTWIRAGMPWPDQPAEIVFPEPKWSPLPRGNHPVLALASRPGGRLLALGRGNEVLLQPIPEGDMKEAPSSAPRLLRGHRDLVRSLAWSPEGQKLASGGHARVILWDPWEESPSLLLTNGLVGRVTALAFDAKGHRLLVADGLPGFSGRLTLFSLEDGSVLKRLEEAHQDTIYGLQLSPQGDRWITASADRTAGLWKAEDLEPQGLLEGHTDFVLAASFNPAGDRAATVGADTLVKIWDVETRKQVSDFSDRQSTLPLSGVWWGWDPTQEPAKPGTDWILTISEDGRPRVWDRVVVHEGAERSSGARMKSWSSGKAGLTSLAALPDGKRFVTGDAEGRLTFWDAKGNLLVQTEEP